jgi:signal transduction histidine kinase
MPQTEGRPRPLGAVHDPAGRTTAAAGALLVAGLGLALEDVGGTPLPLAVAGAGTVAALFVLVPIAAQAAHRRRTLLTALALLVAIALGLTVAGVAVGTSIVADPVDLLFAAAFGGLQLLPLLLVLVAAGGGLVLLADALRGPLGLTTRGSSSWQRLSGRPGRVRAAGVAPGRGLAGLALVALAAVAGPALASAYLGLLAPGALVMLVVVGLGALVVVSTPILVFALVRTDRGHAESAREDERQRVAAHLHDSVLQTLALVQRQASDPTAVARLARRQEHELRAWMAGGAELGTEMLSAALRDAVAEVETEHGAVVETTMLGDRPLDEAGEALAAAAREALRNAARHAPGAPIFVFVQTGPGGTEAFVRDEGAGFELTSVPTERRGVRDAIVGRMNAAGGHATVESVLGEGTEVVLHIDPVRRPS